LILVVLAAGVGFLLPISPRTSVTFVIQGPTNNPPRLTVAYVNYVKIPLGTALASVRNTLVLNAVSESTGPSPIGPYTVAVSVTYNGQTIVTSSFTGLYDGTFQATLTLLRMQETSTVPYVFVLTLFQASSGYQLDQQTANVYPS
jgi:hypothetical protein